MLLLNRHDRCSFPFRKINLRSCNWCMRDKLNGLEQLIQKTSIGQPSDNSD